jgi:hypothetical protein
MPSGSGGQIAFYKSSSLYVAVGSTDRWTNFVSESIEHNLEELEEGAITGRFDAPPSHKGIDFAQGDIVFEPNPNAIGNPMMGLYGTLTTSLLCAAGSTGANSGSHAGHAAYWHQFTPRTSAFDEFSFQEPWGIMVYKDVGSAFMAEGAIFTGLEMAFPAGQLVGATANIMARKVSRKARIAAVQSLVSSGGRPWVWDMASVQVSSGVTGSNSLVANTNFESISVNFQAAHEGVVLLDGNKNYAEFQRNDFRRVEISGTLSFRNQQEYDAFVAYESRFLRITARNVNSQILLGNVASAFYYTVTLNIPSMKFLSWSAPITGPNRIIANFRAKAEYSETDGYMIRAELINVTSGY